MQFVFTLMVESEVREIQQWQYDGQYAIYNMASDAEYNLSEMLDQRSPYYAVRDERGALIGFFCFGTSAQPWAHATPHLVSEDGTVDIGLGMRPDLTGQGLGLAFVEAGLDFARKNFTLQSFRLFVLSFNKRATRVYERAGFENERVFLRRNPQGDVTFLEMRRPA